MGCFWSNESDSIIQRRSEAYERTTTSAGYNNATQSNKPCFGRYKCSSCNWEWNSRRSYASKYQICEKCHVRAYPYYLRPLRDGDMSGDKDPTKKHRKELCQRCRELGRSCGNEGVSKSMGRNRNRKLY